jgi:iron transport multicopper oxidase
MHTHGSYRFRLISMACHPNYVFSIDGHNMTIIEVEGVLVKPLVVDSIQILAGQRYSFIVRASADVSRSWN